MVKEVFGRLKWKLFNTYVDHLLHSFSLLMEIFRSSLSYAIVVNILCTYFCWEQFFIKLKFKNIFLKHQSGCFSAFTINIRMYLACTTKVDNSTAFLLSSTSIIVLLSVVDLHFFLLIVVGFRSEFLCVGDRLYAQGIVGIFWMNLIEHSNISHIWRLFVAYF